MRTTDAQVEALIDSAGSDPGRAADLVALLAEDAPEHAGRSSRASARIRAAVLTALADAGLPAAALPVVVEELETGDEPLLVAAAARAVQRSPAGTVGAGPLLSALENMAGADDVVALDGGVRPVWPPAEPTTAVREVIEALSRLGPVPGLAERIAAFDGARGDLLDPRLRARLVEVGAAAGRSGCCGGSAAVPAGEHRAAPDGPVPDGITVEDQDGDRWSLAGFVAQAPTVLAFFYTRCPNPRKCSLTVTRLARLAAGPAVAEGRARVVAVTYDPDYDDPSRLRAYGRDRGVPFGPSVRMVRAVAGHDALRSHLALRVGYAGSVVNRHAVEVYLLDTSGRVTATWVRRNWEPADVEAVLDGTPVGTPGG